MTLLEPLALVLSLLALPIILMYVLKLRRQEQLLSSILLWRRALDDVQANAPWQRLRPNLLLLLQLLALLALVFVLARPAYSRAHAIAGDVVVIVDESYGMQAHDVHPSRFAVALQQAHGLAADLSPGHVMSVIGMGAQPHLAIAESDDAAALGRDIDGLRDGVSPPNFLATLSLASSLARSGENTRVVVLTSRQSGISSLPLDVPFPVQIVRIGGHLRDLGITAFGATGSGRRERALLRVSNFGSATATSDLNFYVDGQLADVRPFSLDPGKEQTIFWTNLPATNPETRGRSPGATAGVHYLAARIAGADDVATDKSAWAVIPTPATRQVLLVSNGDLFLQNALGADPYVRVTQVKPAEYQPSLAQQFDLVIFDGTLPQSSPTTSALLVGPTRGRIGPLHIGEWAPAGGMAAIRVAGSGPLTTLLPAVDYSDVHVARARLVHLPGWMQPLASTGDGAPLIAAGENDTGYPLGVVPARLALITFNLQESDWPLRISFPVVIQNLVQYLAPGLSLGTSNLTAGQALKLFPSPGARGLQVTLPGGQVDTLRAPYPPFTDTARSGVYTVHELGHPEGTRPGAAASFAVNFFPSRPAPAAGPAVQQIGGSSAGTLAVSFRSVPVLTSIDWVFWLLALLILTGEWWFAFRR